MLVTAFLYVCFLCLGGVISSQDGCTGGKEWQECGTACPLTCDNHDEPQTCTFQCVQGCFCPGGTVEHNGTCVTTDQCPVSCPDSYVYKECGSPCNKTCDNYEETSFCALACSPGCFCPEGTVEHNGMCISPDSCPEDCTGGKEWQECGTACPLTCDNHDQFQICTFLCVQGCFCPAGTVEHNGTCVTTDQCPESTSSCPDSYVYKECGSPCTKTCDNYEETSFCALACSPGCFCPEGTVEHNGTCITTDQCPETTPSCPDSYIYKECGSPCTKTCDNYEEISFCALICSPGCFCPEGTVEHNGACITTDQCPETTPSCPDSYVYKECGSPCTKTCDNYEETSFCALACSPGCYCPEGTVEHNGMCISPDSCPKDCTGGKEWQECGTACPLTCDNYDELQICTLQCVQGCFCTEGTVDLNGVCVEKSVCADCRYCREGQKCSVALIQDRKYAYCKDPIGVPCSEDTLSCSSNSRCLTHNTTGTSFCLESCYLENGGCSDDQVCYYEKRDEDCNPLLESCFKTTCTKIPSDLESCPIGWVLDDCGSLCQRSCEDYISGTQLFCAAVCAPPDCVCPQGMVVFRDRCVDPLECFTLMTDAPDLNPLPVPDDSVLLRISLVGVKIEDFDSAQFAEDIEQLVKDHGFKNVEVSVYAAMEDDDSNTVVVLLLKGDSVEGGNSDVMFTNIITENPNELDHEVAAISSVDSRAVTEASNSLSPGAMVGVVIALSITCAALVIGH